MTKEQKERLVRSAHVAKHNLQAIALGNDPHCTTLAVRREHADWQIGYLLEAIVEVLPKDVRASIQACIDIDNEVWNEAYQHDYYHGQQKTSPECLAASDSL